MTVTVTFTSQPDEHLLCALPTTIVKEYLMEEWCVIPPAEFQRLEQSVPGSLDAALAAFFISFVAHLYKSHMEPSNRLKTLNARPVYHLGKTWSQKLFKEGRAHLAMSCTCMQH